MGVATPAKGVGRESVARVQIPRSPPKNTGNHRFPVFLRFMTSFCLLMQIFFPENGRGSLQLFYLKRGVKAQNDGTLIVLFPLNSHSTTPTQLPLSGGGFRADLVGSCDHVLDRDMRIAQGGLIVRVTTRSRDNTRLHTGARQLSHVGMAAAIRR